jgi:hypothetical protein
MDFMESGILTLCGYVVVFLVTWRLLIHWNGDMFGRNAARETRKSLVSAFSSGFECVAVDPSAFPHLDHMFYERVTSEASALGFTCMGDIELLHFTRAYPKLRTFLRVLLGDEGTVVLSLNHMKVRGWAGFLVFLNSSPRSFRTIGLETEFTDGTFIGTVNSLGADPLESPPGIMCHKMPQNTTFVELLVYHRDAVSKYVEAENVAPVHLETLDELLEFESRHHEITSSFRESRGYVTREEISRMSGVTPQMQRGLSDELERLHETDQDETA